MLDAVFAATLSNAGVTPVRGEKWFHARQFAGSTRSTSLRASSALALPRSVQEFFERWVGRSAERGGFCVMLFGQVFRRRLRGGVNDREIKMRIGVIGISGDGFEYFFFRRFLPALLDRGDAEII